jgi:endonuclease YncB( thermonuclease family)
MFGGAVRVVDGDTLDVGDIRVRLHAIDAPELDQLCTRPKGVRWDCGAWVADELRAWIGPREARCETIEMDRYGRTVARCTVAGRDLGRVLVRSGLAVSYRKYSMAYYLDEKAAVVAGRGLHAYKMLRPARHRRDVGATSVRQPGPPDRACAIKGNISRAGTRIHHLPGQHFYDRTVIRPEDGERWFCTETEARAAGWRRARR